MGKTLWLRAGDPGAVERAAALLEGGGCVAFPTETVYGLGANALSAEAVAAVFQAKGRPVWDPLIVHVAEVGRVRDVAEVRGRMAERLRVLAEAFWPGPLTILLPRGRAVPSAVTAGRALVGVRVPAHRAAQALLRTVKVPLAAPSANRFGHVSPTTAEHVMADLDGRIAAVLDAGPCPVGVESTVLDPGSSPMVVYRAGAVTVEAIADACGEAVQLFAGEPEEGRRPESLLSPGMGMRHYAPEAEVRLTVGTPEAVWGAVGEAVSRGLRVGVLLPADWPVEERPEVIVELWGRWDDAEALAAGLFAGLRGLEADDVEVIVCPLPEPGGVRDAVRDRLEKAARAR